MTKRHELTVMHYYSKALVYLQDLIPIAHKSDEIESELRKRRPRYFRIKIWDEAIDKVLEYVKSHKDNFKNGRLVI